MSNDFWNPTFLRRKFKNFRKKETKRTIFIYFLLCKQILSLFWRGLDLNDLDLTKIKSISDWFGFALFFIWFDLKFWNFLQNDLIWIWKLSKWFGFVKFDKIYQIHNALPKTYQCDVWDRLKYKTSKSGPF